VVWEGIGRTTGRPYPDFLAREAPSRFMGGENGAAHFWEDVARTTVQDALVSQAADVMQGAAQGVAETGNRYSPELLKTAEFAALATWTQLYYKLMTAKSGHGGLRRAPPDYASAAARAPYSARSQSFSERFT
jgi:hypothetical protein